MKKLIVILLVALSACSKHHDEAPEPINPKGRIAYIQSDILSECKKYVLIVNGDTIAKFPQPDDRVGYTIFTKVYTITDDVRYISDGNVRIQIKEHDTFPSAVLLDFGQPVAADLTKLDLSSIKQ